MFRTPLNLALRRMLITCLNNLLENTFCYNYTTALLTLQSYKYDFVKVHQLTSRYNLILQVNRLSVKASVHSLHKILCGD
jgi:hypothetical protein